MALRLLLIPAFLFCRPTAYSWKADASTYGEHRNADVLNFVSQMLPFLIYPVGYGEQGKFIAAMYVGQDECLHDRTIQQYDRDLFGMDVSKDFRGASTDVPHMLFAEYLQFAYFGLYIIAFGVPLFLVLTRRNNPKAMDHAACTLLITSYICWICYLSYPVAGPLWCFEKPEAQNVGYYFAQLNLWLQAEGAAHGTATPSSHCAGSVGLWIVSMWYHKPLAIGLAFIAPALCFATFYLQYHYAFDAMIGTPMGIVLPFIAWRVCELMRDYLDLVSVPSLSSMEEREDCKPILKDVDRDVDCGYEAYQQEV